MIDFVYWEDGTVRCAALISRDDLTIQLVSSEAWRFEWLIIFVILFFMSVLDEDHTARWTYLLPA